jgi:hypothetical protein
MFDNNLKINLKVSCEKSWIFCEFIPKISRKKLYTRKKSNSYIETRKKDRNKKKEKKI